MMNIYGQLRRYWLLQLIFFRPTLKNVLDESVWENEMKNTCCLDLH